MKKFFYLLGVALLAYQCSTDPSELYNSYGDGNDIELQASNTRSMNKVGDSLFVADNGKYFAVNPNVITVKLKTGENRTKLNISELRSNRLGYIDIQVPEGVDIEEYISQLENSGEFISVEYNTIGEYCFSPNDNRFNDQWYLNTINAPSAWNISTGSANIKVAVIDSGVDWNHPDLGVGSDGYSNIDASLGWNYITGNSNVITTNDHGTRVAGIIAAKTNNSGRGIAGIAGGKANRGITIIPYCVGVTAPSTSVLDDAILDAVDKGARVIQLSLSIGSTPAVTAAINEAVENGVVVVCASGNSRPASPVSYPALLNNVIAVGAIAKNNIWGDFSNYGSNLNVVAPGIDILSTTLNGNYNSQDGTSFAAPQVSAIAALILSKYPNFTQKQVADIIESTARKVGNYSYTTQSGRPNGTWNNQMGYGLVDAHAALFGNLTISGPDKPAKNSTVTYSFPTPPTGVTFAGWTVTPGTNGVDWQAVNMNANPLQVTFEALGSFTIKATFTLPGDVSYSATKSVNVPTPPPPFVLQTPWLKGELYTMIVPYPNSSPPLELSADTAETDIMESSNSNEGYTADAGPGKPIDMVVNMLRFYVQNVQSVIYEWKINGSTTMGSPYWGPGTYITDVPCGSDTLRVCCRAIHNGEITGWSNTVTATAAGIQTEFFFIDPNDPIEDPDPNPLKPIDKGGPIGDPVPIDPIDKGGPFEVVEP